jgi:hypothetical protein
MRERVLRYDHRRHDTAGASAGLLATRREDHD